MWLRRPRQFWDGRRNWRYGQVRGWRRYALVRLPSRLRYGLVSQLPWRWRLMIRIPLYTGAALAAGIGALFIYYAMLFPNPMALGQRDRAPIIRVLDRNGQTLAERGAPADYLPIDLIPEHVRHAVIATEDQRFYRHWGIDPWGVMRAAFANLRAGRVAQGGSTITQQLAKNVFLTAERTIERKVEELLLALWLEVRLGKDEILELYLNRVYFGAGAYGIEAAAQRFFDKSARNLTLPEAAVIAGLLKAPSRYSPSANPGGARARGRVVLARMADAGFIPEPVAATARAEIVRFAGPSAGPDASGVDYAVDFVLDRLPRLIGVGHSELVVETTFDSSLQRAAQDLIRDGLAKQVSAEGADQGAAIVMANDGAVLAMVGGRDYAESQFNRVVRSRRQPGSAFKPIVFLAAVEAGLEPTTIVRDVPTTVGGWSPRNDDGVHRDRVELRRALAQSINTVAVRLLIELGSARVIEAAHRLGIASDLHAKPSLALGTAEVTPLELTTAYAALANGGWVVRPYAVSTVRLSSGRVLYTRQAAPARRVVAPEHVAAMNDMLSHVVTSGTGRRARLGRHAVAGKTGTTQDYRDAWFVGYTAHATAAVWIGNDHGRPMDRVTGGSLPAELWRRIMTVAHQGRPPRPLPYTPPGPADELTRSSSGSDAGIVSRLTKAAVREQNDRAGQEAAP